MKKNVHLAISLVMLLVFSSLVYSAGESTTERKNRRSDGTGVSNGNSDVTIPNCEDFQLRPDRIKCRLKNREKLSEMDKNWETEESCRNLPLVVSPTAATRITAGTCRALYATTKQCYNENLDQERREKCFLRAVGLDRKVRELTREEVAVVRDNIRQKAVLHLYNIQEKIEKKQKEGKISDEKAAEIIDLTIVIKEKIMKGARKAEVKDQITELRNKIREAVRE